jgi:hypothetical protein
MKVFGREFFSNEVPDPFKGEEPVAESEAKASDAVRARYKWKRVDAPKPWRPKEVGVWRGLVALSGDRSFKDFEVFVAQGEPLSEDDPYVQVISSSGQVPVRQ